MKIYLNLKPMTFEDGIEHKIINAISGKSRIGYEEFNIDKENKFIKDAMKVKYKKDTDEIEGIYFTIKKQVSWWSFPLYELKDGEIIDFDYTHYQYFANTDRRNAIAGKISSTYSGSTELKILRKTMKRILNHLGLIDVEFEKYNNKIEEIINKNPK